MVKQVTIPLFPLLELRSLPNSKVTEKILCMCHKSEHRCVDIAIHTSNSLCHLQCCFIQRGVPFLLYAYRSCRPRGGGRQCTTEGWPLPRGRAGPSRTLCSRRHRHRRAACCRQCFLHLPAMSMANVCNARWYFVEETEGREMPATKEQSEGPLTAIGWAAVIKRKEHKVLGKEEAAALFSESTCHQLTVAGGKR